MISFTPVLTYHNIEKGFQSLKTVYSSKFPVKSDKTPEFPTDINAIFLYIKKILLKSTDEVINIEQNTYI